MRTTLLFGAMPRGERDATSLSARPTEHGVSRRNKRVVYHDPKGSHKLASNSAARRVTWDGRLTIRASVSPLPPALPPKSNHTTCSYREKMHNLARELAHVWYHA